MLNVTKTSLTWTVLATYQDVRIIYIYIYIYTSSGEPSDLRYVRNASHFYRLHTYIPPLAYTFSSLVHPC